MNTSRLFLFAYTCSGLAGLIYQVCWTRLLTLYIGHGTAAASVVVAASLGGLAAGAGAGGAVATRLAARQSLVAYAALEILVAISALLLPLELRAFMPLLSWAYGDGAASLLFPAARVAVCLVAVFVPACALGATFPTAVRWFAAGAPDRARSSGALYALNTAGAAVGALAAGFVLIPAIGVSGTTWLGVGASVLAAVSVGVIARAPEVDQPATPPAPSRRARKRRPSPSAGRPVEPQWLAAAILGVSGFAALVNEIAWTRVLTLVIGPTIYAFSAALAAVVTGVAAGSSAGTAIVGRARRPAFWLAIVLAGAGVTGVVTASLAGGPIPRLVAEQIAASPGQFDALVWRGAVLTTLLMLPTAALLGAAFPLALAMIDNPSRPAAGQFGTVYAVNSAGSVAGAFAAGFVLIPFLGLEGSLTAVTLILLAASVAVLGLASLTPRARAAGALACAAALGPLFLGPSWDRELLASGAYLYAPFAPRGVDLETMLKAGTLLYYREGAASTISVKRLTGTTTLAVDGKTDASNRGDMLTQKLVAHLPLLLHERPRDVAIVGLGSGVSVGAALRHPIARTDVLEISPEVVEASRYFAEENRHALADPRTSLIVGDGRSHLHLSRRAYDVIISEPSNPWIAGVAALFTREFFLAARERLAPGGLVCQWTNAYNISDADLRAIVATFLSVFPHGTAWLVGADDVVLIASDGPLDERLANVERHWQRPGVADDLATVGAVEPFSLWSLYVGGPRELQRYAGAAEPLTDDRMRLEFSGPRELHAQSAGANGAALRALLAAADAPAAIRNALAAAGAAEWRRRGDMMVRRDAFTSAYDDYRRALELDVDDRGALDGLVRTAVLIGRERDALDGLQSLSSGRAESGALLVARSKLLAADGAQADAIAAARRAADHEADRASALEQLASLHADSGENGELDATIARMRDVMPEHPATWYYAGVAAFLRGDAAEALTLAGRALARDPSYGAAHDLIGAAHTRLGAIGPAREAFLASLRADAHDSTAYANLGVLALTAGDREAAADYFAEALWLDTDSTLAREGLARVGKGP